MAEYGVIQPFDDKRASPASVALVLTDHPHDGVGLITLNRPSRRNALSQASIDTLLAAFRALEADEAIRVIVLTSAAGIPFSAGADLSDLRDMSTADAHRLQYLQDLATAIPRVKKPIIAAVEGFALGGGFELALMCDILYVAQDARLGLPEVNVGTIPGIGGTQRLTRLVGKHLAMKMILTGASLSPAGLASCIPGVHIVPTSELRQAALDCAIQIAEKSGPVVALAKQAVIAAEAGLEGGFARERDLYYSSFDLKDKTEGVSAFLEKRQARWLHQ